MGARKPVLPVIAVCCVLVGWLVWACVPAFAGTGFGLSFSFSPPQGFNGPTGLAVDDTAGLSKGDVYVADQGNNKLEEFSPAGVLLAEVEIPGAELNQIAIEQYPNLVYEGDVYVVGKSNGVVYRFGPELALKQEIKGLSEPTAVAVDEAGNVLVSEFAGHPYEAKVLEFNAAGEPINATGAPDPANTVVEAALSDSDEGVLSNEPLEFPEAVAVDASGKDLYVASGGYHEGLNRYTLSGDTYIPSEIQTPSAPFGVTLSSTGNVLVDTGRQIIEYGPSGTARLAESEFEFGVPAVLSEGRGIGANSESGDIYLADHANNLVYVFEEGPTPEVPETTTPTEISSSTATLNGVLKRGSGKDETSGYYFSYKYGTRCEKQNNINEFSPTARTAGRESKVQAEVSELKYASEYTFCLVATNKYGITFGSPVSFDTAGIPPKIENDLPADVGVSGVTLTANINPGGPQTTYRFEYGPTSSYGLSTPETTLGTGTESILATAQVIGLAPDTEYHYRIVASNEKGSEASGDASFTTFASVFHGLPDGRVYEQVSRRENQERSISFPKTSDGLDGSGFDGISTESPFQPSLSGDAITYGGEPSSPGGTGNGGLGESNQYLATRSPDGGWSQVNLQPPGYHSATYQAFSNELSTGILAASSEGEGSANYLPPLAPSAPVGVKVVYTRTLGEESYQPLFTAIPPNRRSRLEAYGVPRDGPNGGEPAYAGASADGSRLLFEANDALVPGAEAGEGQANNLYESVDGQLHLVNIPPEGPSKVGATFGGLAGPEENGPDFEHVISEDGTRVFWTSVGTGIIYVREDGAKTVQVSAGRAQYRGATPDGRDVFYIENRQLWRFDVETEARTELTPEGSTANVRGVIGIGGNGEYVYFVARGVLAEGATEGESNIYLLHDGATSFIATLENGEGESMPPYSANEGIAAGDWAPGMRGRTAEVTPDGQAMVFMSTRSLTGYDNVAAYQGGPVAEVYVYEAEDNHLFCASCNRSGEPPYQNNNEELDKGAAAGYLPISWSNTYLPQWISDDGSRVFFDSDVPLVPADTNNRQDVYEWERDSAGSCQESGGCVYLLSGGLNPSASWLVGASASGNDVFFVTRAKLTPEDGTEADVLYDARVDGVQPPAPPACTGTGCQGVPPAPPVFATPSSVTFNGVGNFTSTSTQPVTHRSAKKVLTRAQKLSAALRACKGKRKKRRASCEAQARARYGKVSHASKASRGRK